MTSLPTLQAVSRSPVVLLVDDQPIVGEAIRRSLADEKDIRFHYCADPRTALGVSAAVSPTVILQDLVMPQMDGLALLRHFRASPHTREVPLIVLSTEDDPKVKADAFASGANDYLVKLPDKVELIARIRHHSRGYIGILERNEAFAALVESQRQLEIRNQFIREAFGRYVSDEVVHKLLETPEGLNLGGERRNVTMLMADLRGFTPLAETLPPETIVQTVNNYLAIITEVISGYGGTINEIVGDGLLIVFGAPLAADDHAERGVACALAMQMAMARVNERNVQEGLPALSMGIGINTGEVVVGNIGSDQRTKYALVGNNVNLTARIESCTSGGEVLIANATKEAIGDILMISDRIDVELKGMREPVVLYEVNGMGGKHDLHLSERRSKPIPVAEDAGVSVTYRIMAEKQVSAEEGRAVLKAVCEHDIEMVADRNVPSFTNLRLDFSAADGTTVARNAYGKVLSSTGDLLRVRLTSVPPDCEELLQRLMHPRSR